MRHLLGSKLWDCYSLGYDFLTRSFLKDVRKQYIEKLLSLSPLEKKIENVLIIGVGTGEDLNFIDPEINVTAIDYSLSMLKIANNKKHLNCQLLRMDAHELDFPDSSFQRILLPLILAVAEDPKLCLKEAHRVLKPGGRLIVFDKFLNRNEKPSLLRKILNFFSNLIATQINLDIYQLINNKEFSNLIILEENPILLKGWFKLFVLEKQT